MVGGSMNIRQRYPSDLTDHQWENIEYLFSLERQPACQPRQHRTPQAADRQSNDVPVPRRLFLANATA